LVEAFAQTPRDNHRRGATVLGVRAPAAAAGTSTALSRSAGELRVDVLAGRLDALAQCGVVYFETENRYA
jgi:hypothetical protein